jgi:hypothetical protein
MLGTKVSERMELTLDAICTFPTLFEIMKQKGANVPELLRCAYVYISSQESSPVAIFIIFLCTAFQRVFPVHCVLYKMFCC